MTSPNQFEEFWSSYPLKVKKLAARKAWIKSAAVAEFDKIMAGLEAYKKFKPATQDWCHAATWLNGERWDDEWTLATRPPAIRLPNELDVLTYCRDKGGTDRDWQFAKDWLAKWARRGFKENGRIIDWKITFSEEFARQRQ